ncbi:MAG TPA: response regulator [Candidatus Eisenbacteria bacterium]|nr:response regulator [Candidatus Eisenbacteria bacterium]
MGRKKLLVVDDEPLMRRVLRVTLSTEGFDVVEAASGEEALERLSTGSWDFVLLDLNLPGLDGIDTCRAIRANSDVPIIVVSIRDSEGDKAAARQAGADDYLTKPFNFRRLAQRIWSVSLRKSGFRF